MKQLLERTTMEYLSVLWRSMSFNLAKLTHEQELLADMNIIVQYLARILS